MRVGWGYDVHRLIAGRPLILGGLTIPFERGLTGHSDADVVLHAICDALLGAAALGDLGKHFPDTDPRYRGMSSLKFLAEVRDRIQAAGLNIGNIDATIVCERPKLAEYIPAMVEKISDTLVISTDQLNIKATTEEGMGFTGTGEGIAVQAVAFLE